jgi:outer membrane protein assembly factor BamB/uncharacterized membrane protein YidH (DUF202 family)
LRESAIAAWPAGGPTLLWQRPLGQGFSGIVVANGRAYTQHQTASGQELVCFDITSGAVVWRTRYAFPWEIDGRYPGPYGTPTIAGNRVYFSDCYGVVCCADAGSGSLLWQFDAAKKLNPAGVDFGYAAAPLVIGGRVYAPAPASEGGATVFCLEAATGTLQWQTSGAVPSYASVNPITLQGKECLLLPLRNGVAIYDRANGAELWKDEWTRGYDEHSCWPVYQEPFLFFPSAFRRGGRVYRLALAEGRVQGETVWEDRVMSNDVFSSALHEGHLYGFDVQSQQSDLLGRTRGTLKCVELATGQVRWTQTGIKHCTVTPVGSRFLLLEDEGDLVLMEPSPEAYRELARATLPQKAKFWATPVVIGDRLLIRSADSIACYSLGPGEATPTTAVAARETSADPNTTRLAEAVRAWFARYRSEAFIAPSIRTLLAWYGYSITLLLGSLALARVRGRHRWHVRWVWPAVALGVCGTVAITQATGRFSLTAPLALFALFCLAVAACRDPGDAEAARKRGLRPILQLLGFIALCYGYFRLCGSLFLVSGWGFLAGFPAVVLLAGIWQRSGIAQKAGPATLLWSPLAFTAYFWSSAVAVMWNAK